MSDNQWYAGTVGWALTIRYWEWNCQIKNSKQNLRINTLLFPSNHLTLLTKTVYYKLNWKTKLQKPNQLGREPKFSRWDRPKWPRLNPSSINKRNTTILHPGLKSNPRTFSLLVKMGYLTLSTGGTSSIHGTRIKVTIFRLKRILFMTPSSDTWKLMVERPGPVANHNCLLD